MAGNQSNFIPFDKGTVEYGLYEKLQDLVANRNPEDKPRILLYTDIEQDYDDLLAVIFLAEMHRMGAIELAGCVANHEPVENNHEPTEKRAKFLRTILHLLGLPEVPVARGTVGTDDLEKHGRVHFFGLKNATFENQSWNLKDFEKGASLVDRLVDPKRPLTVLLISSLQDISEYFTAHDHDQGAFLRTNFRKFVSQGGYKWEKQADNSYTLKPEEKMMNNQYNLVEADKYTACLQQHKLPSDAWFKHVATKASLDPSFMKSLFKYGPIGQHFEWLWLRQEFKYFWDPFNLPFMPHLHKEWYLKTRLGLSEGDDDYKRLNTGATSFDMVEPLIKGIAYDCCAAVGAVGDDFMKKMGILGALPSYNRETHHHRVFGKDLDDLGGINEKELAEVMRVFLLGSLKQAHQAFLLGSLKPAHKTIKDDTTFEELGMKHSYHDNLEKDLNLARFKREFYPLMKPFMDYQAKIKGFKDEAKEAKKRGDVQKFKEKEAEAKNEDEEIDRKELREKLVPLLKVKSKDQVVRDKFKIPYEELYQEALQKVKTTR